jgi:hypothetical protein
MLRGRPRSGEGANLAMFDGAELGKVIAAHGRYRDGTVAFEAVMFSHSESEAADQILELYLGERPPFGLIEFFAGVREGEGVLLRR